MPQPIENEFASGQLLLLSTDEQNFAFDLWETFRIAIGRHPSNDISLSSRKVSNYHAEILNEGDGWLLHDLGSTNGTYLNDEKVRRQRLKDGDRIRTGGYVLKVRIQAREEQAATDGGLLPVGSKGRFASTQEQTMVPQTASPSGRRDPSLADLLRVLSRGKPARGLLLRNTVDEEGRIYVDGGRVVHAELGNLRAEKAVYRMFRWPGGTYEVMELPEGQVVPRSIELPTDALASEGAKQMEQMEKLIQLLPPPTVELRLKEDCPLPLCQLSPTEIDLFQLVIRHGTLQKVLEASPLPDLRILELVHGLLQKKVFTVAGSSNQLLEETFVLRQ